MGGGKVGKEGKEDGEKWEGGRWGGGEGGDNWILVTHSTLDHMNKPHPSIKKARVQKKLCTLCPPALSVHGWVLR